MNDRTENRSSNRTNNCKSQNRTSNRTENRTDDRTENRATNEHKHPNQYTKGARRRGQVTRTSPSRFACQCPFHREKPAAFPALFSSAESSRAFAFYFWFGSKSAHSFSNSSSTRGIWPVR